MARYKCIENFSLQLYEDDFPVENKFIDVGLGTIWESDSTQNIIGADIHLDNKDSYDWIEISDETLDKCFEIMEGEQNG